MGKKIIKKLDCIFLDTYDGSYQVVHPHIIIYNELLYLICTPYPYGMEEYENPSLFFGNNINSLRPFLNNPIANQGEQKKGHHLSDPYLFASNNNLLCIYRESNLKNQKLHLLNIDNMSSKLIYESNNDDLISPIVISRNDTNYVFYVTMNECNNSIVKCVVFDNNYNVKYTNICEVVSPFDEYYIWHFDIHPDDINENIIRAIFLLRCKRNNNIYKLFVGHFEFNSNKWVILKQVQIPQKKSKKKKFVYKSCYIPNSNKILLNFIDKKNRYYLSIISE